MKLSVVIPCFNEVKTLGVVVDAVRAAEPADKEIIVVDDCSTDGSRKILEKLEKAGGVTACYHGRNQGKGAALRTGFAKTAGDIVIVQDADLEYQPSEFMTVIGPILNGEADAVFGSRFISNRPHRVMFFWHAMGNRFLTLLSNMLTNLNLTDMETCYKAFKGDLIRSIKIEEDRFGFEPEITAKIAKRRARIFEVGISYHGRTYEEGKKIGWRDGVRAIWCILKYNLIKT
ncbi:MAG: glycosyltransferase family 2 protein [Rhodospirillales bacterium]